MLTREQYKLYLKMQREFIKFYEDLLSGKLWERHTTTS